MQNRRIAQSNQRLAEPLVPRRGLEPPLLAEHGPEPCASTNSAIWAGGRSCKRAGLTCQRAFSTAPGKAIGLPAIIFRHSPPGFDPDQGGTASAEASFPRTDRGIPMPTETIIVLSAVIGAFAFFAGMLTFADLTWSKPPRRKGRERR